MAAEDPETWSAIRAEIRRQQETVELIASENYVSQAVLEAQGSALTNKYAEGYPGHRYYGGCQFVDIVERLAIERACALFGSEHANVQPHSGSQANAAAYLALLQPGDTALAMRLAHGGHLTHGASFNFSGRLYRFYFYGVDRESERLDYDEVERQARRHRPRLILAGASAYPRIIDFARLADIARSVGAYLMIDMAHIAGLVAAGVHPSPVPRADVVTTTTHKTLRGPRAGMILCPQRWATTIDKAVFPGTQGGPLMHIIAAKAVALHEAARPEFVHYQRQVVANAQALAEELRSLGLRLVSGGTDNHLLLVDVSPLGLTGAQAEAALETAGVAANKNLIPYDERGPRETSGIRLGTAAVTTRGFREPEMRQVAHLIGRALSRPDDAAALSAVRDEARDLCLRFPIPSFRG
ncbi:MAG: serine hydroxymethyltransferase [Anaerolineae bacterium]|nr:serine hydroxymethyltransferase [Anaerolineae bacterium]